MECEEFILPDWSPPDIPIQSERAKRASSSIMECGEFILPDWSPPDNPIQSERAKRASFSIMEREEFILPDWSPPDDPARGLAAAVTLVCVNNYLLHTLWKYA